LKLKIFASIAIFAGSYFPLSLILLAQDFRFELLDAQPCWPVNGTDCVLPFRNGLFPIIIFAVCSVGFVISLLALWSIRPKTAVDIIEVKHVPAELMSYTLPYVVSFMNLEYQETGKFVGLIIFLFWIFLITYRSGQLILNPLLVVLGWRLYEVKYRFPGDDKTHTGKALSRSHLEPGVRYKQLQAQDILVISK